MRKGQFSTPVKVVLGVAALLMVVAILLFIIRPNLFGFASASNSTVGSSFGGIKDLL